MKKIYIICLCLSLTIIAAACGGGDTNTNENEAKPSKDGFDASTNQELEYCGMVFSVPDYCEFKENEGGDLDTMLEGDHGMISLMSSDSSISEEEFAEKKADLIKEWNKKIECETTDDDGSFVTTNDSGTELTGKSAMILNSDNKKLIVLVLYQSENAEYDYISDFDAIVESAHKADDSADTDTTASVYYSTNSEDTVRDGNAGVYAYKNRGNSYDIYYIIDLDEGYVYNFTDGDGNEDGDRVKIDSGDLNDVLMVTYNFDGDPVPYGFHFKYKNNPEHLVVQDNDGFELDFSPTDLSKALALRDGKNIKDY